MTLKQLEAFYWAASCSNFAIAAAQLHLSQSSLSKRISELEGHLRCELFDRSGHKAILTKAGERLLPKVRIMLAASEDIRATIDETGVIRGRCRFGSGEIAASSWLPRFVVDAMNTYPDLVLEPYVGRELEHKLIGGEFDFSITSKKSSYSTIRTELIAQVEFVWVIAAQLPCPKHNAVQELIHQLPIISMQHNAGLTQVLNRWQQSGDHHDVTVLTCNNMSAIASLVAAGLGISYFPKGWITPLVKRKIVKTLPDIPLPKLDYYFQWRSGDQRALIQRMKELVLRHVDYTHPVLML